MPVTVTCPVDERVSVTYPAPGEWTVRHREQFSRGFRQAGEEATLDTAKLFGCLAVAQVSGLPADPLDYPLAVFEWLVAEVYGAYSQERYTPKNLSGPAPITPSEA